MHTAHLSSSGQDVVPPATDPAPRFTLILEGGLTSCQNCGDKFPLAGAFSFFQFEIPGETLFSLGFIVSKV